MRTGGFRFAVLLSLALAAAAVAVAATYHLPLRDPDGVAVPTYVRLPIILLLAFLTDVVPRAAVAGPAPAPDPRTLVAVIRERWQLGARALRPGRPRRVVPHLRGLPEPQELRAVREPTPLRPDAGAPRPDPVARPRPGDGAAPRLRCSAGRPSSSRSSTSPGSCSCRLPGGRAGLVARPDRRRVVRHGHRGRLGAGRRDVLRGADARTGLRPAAALRRPCRTPTSPRCRTT